MANQSKVADSNMSLRNPTISQPGAMSLLDKYASLNSSIEDARRRVAETRSQLESTNLMIENLREENHGMIEETQSAKADMSRIEFELREITKERNLKVDGKTHVEREHQMSKREYDNLRGRIENERMKFLERCREFRASCKRMRAAASILAMDRQFDSVGEIVSEKENTNGIDLWRRLQEDEFLSSDDDNSYDDMEDGAVQSKNARSEFQKIRITQEKRHENIDPEMEQAKRDEKQSRQTLIKAECDLHAVKNEQADAVKRSTSRSQKLTQQRAQLDKHRKEVDELERELCHVKHEIVEANQLGKAFEKGEPKTICLDARNKLFFECLYSAYLNENDRVQQKETKCR